MMKAVRSYLSICLLGFLLLSCGNSGGTFRLEGRLRNMNQGEFWVYSPDGGMNGIDTITVRSGRFSYELQLDDDATLVIIFPNYSEQPVFASPGKSVNIKGDATHLKEVIIQGTDENEDMTSLRMELNDLMPPDIPDAVSEFITAHPASRASIYLLNRYFILSPEPNFRKALSLVKRMQKEAPDNEPLKALAQKLPKWQGGQKGSRLPKFTATDIKGAKVSEAALKHELNVLFTWASWNYQSTNAQYLLRKLKKKYGERLGVVSICLDAKTDNCRQIAKRDSIPWQTVCDGKMWETPLLTTLGLNNIPGNLLVDNKGVVIARDLTNKQLEERINNILK